MMRKGQGPAQSSLATCDESMEDVWWKYGWVPQRYEDDSATMSKYGINPRARQFPNHRHPTTQHALYSVIPSPTYLFLYVLRTSSTQHMHHLTRGHCYTPFLLNLPNPCCAYISFLTKPQLPTIQVSKSPMMLCIVVFHCFVTSLLGPTPFWSVPFTIIYLSMHTEEISKRVYSNQRCDRQHPRRVATRPTNMLQTEFHWRDSELSSFTIHILKHSANPWYCICRYPSLYPYV